MLPAHPFLAYTSALTHLLTFGSKETKPAPWVSGGKTGPSYLIYLKDAWGTYGTIKASLPPAVKLVFFGPAENPARPKVFYGPINNPAPVYYGPFTNVAMENPDL
jgi:hypothetical protein